jgi:hypothetical protein
MVGQNSHACSAERPRLGKAERAEMMKEGVGSRDLHWVHPATSIVGKKRTRLRKFGNTSWIQILVLSLI